MTYLLINFLNVCLSVCVLFSEISSVGWFHGDYGREGVVGTQQKMRFHRSPSPFYVSDYGLINRLFQCCDSQCLSCSRAEYVRLSSLSDVRVVIFTRFVNLTDQIIIL